MISRYTSPLGEILLAADELGLSGLWFAGQKYFAPGIDLGAPEEENTAIAEAKRWLDGYFAGERPSFLPQISLHGSAFQEKVWRKLLEIPYGSVTTYGRIAGQIGQETGKRVSAQAVGGAVGHNPISLIVPCHRVVGAAGSLTGYAGGLGKKQYLLKWEGVDTTGFFIPKKGTAL